ncbi:DUF1707 domain-containing protein [Blastococcus sp. TF02A-35]|uniref:DUF1707 SHOCT-like domain-containing protein n=1 Tax=Blastococcus sp. TF02A-35 TaxID=2559612 RepID=UPI001073D4CE|nr:DUF1707 domain-containing protein [Blastococcus sp. TF02A_35]TFV45988.1 DUF1707 domain-containing protein [Blastococcus sp. TF02A_35]
MPEPHLRAADADRTAVATALGEHMAAGRLTVAEYEERLERAYAARTYGELAVLTDDLPPAGLPAVPAPAPAPSPARWHGADAAAWRSWASTALIVTAIWAVTALANWELLYFWPAWVIGPWGAVLVAQMFFGDDDGTDDGPARALHGR